MKCSIQRGYGELNSTFHLSPNENICSIARMRKHSLFAIYNLYKDSNSSTNSKEKELKTTFAQAKRFASRACNSTQEVLRGRLRHA